MELVDDEITIYMVNLYTFKIPIDFSIHRDPYGAMGPWEFTIDFGAAPAKVAGCKTGCEKYNCVCRAWRPIRVGPVRLSVTNRDCAGK